MPSAITAPWSITTMLSASTSASSRYCVVSSTVVPPSHEVLDHAPQLVATLRVEAGGGLVEEQHRRPVHERGGEVEPAAHATGVGARRRGRPRASSANCSSSSSARASISPPSRWVSLPTSARFSRPVRFSSTAAYWPASPMLARTVCGSSLHVDAEHAGGAAVGPQQRGEHAHDGGLAGTVGPEQAEHLALRHLERDALDRLDVAEALHQAVGHDRRFCHGSPP